MSGSAACPRLKIANSGSTGRLPGLPALDRGALRNRTLTAGYDGRSTSKGAWLDNLQRALEAKQAAAGAMRPLDHDPALGEPASKDERANRGEPASRSVAPCTDMPTPARMAE